jgi:hypothetical protein
MIVLNCKQGTPEWLDARSGAVTASRFREARERIGGLNEKQQKYIDLLKDGVSEKAAAGEAGYAAKPKGEWIERALSGARMDVPSAIAIKYAWLIALERIARMPLDDTFVTWQMRRGQDEEPNARNAYEVATGSTVLEAGVVLTDDRLFGYSTDGFVDDDGMVEIKVPSAPDKIGLTWTRPEEVIEEYRDQINGGLWITGRQWCDLVIYTPWLRNVGKEMFVQRFERDEAAIEALEADLWDFAKLVRGMEMSLRRKPDEAFEEVSAVVVEEAVVRMPLTLVKTEPFVDVGDLPADIFAINK